MSLEPIGLAVLLIGLLCLAKRREFAIHVLFPSTIFLAAAAVILTSIGSSSIPPAQVLLGFFILVVLRGRMTTSLVAAIAPFRPGFWLLLLVTYGVLSAAFLPRIFAGLSEVYAVARVENEVGVFLTPLRPVNGNITQPVYLIGDLLCFLAVWSLSARREFFRAVVHAAILTSVLNVAFAGADLLTYFTGTEYLLQFIRNANYTMLSEAEVSGLKRIVGSYPEASSYASYALGQFAFCIRLFMSGIYPKLTGSVAFLTFASLVGSTSSTAYAGLGVTFAVIYGGALLQTSMRSSPRNTVLFVGFAPLALLLTCLALMLQDGAWAALIDMLDRSLFTKLETNSGIERAAWNTQALINFIDTFGLGAGVGSVRASSFLAAVPANVGILGTFFYLAFLWTVFFSSASTRDDTFVAGTQAAARMACFALLVAGSIAASAIDLGLQFFLFAALACAPVEPASACRQATPLNERPEAAG